MCVVSRRGSGRLSIVCGVADFGRSSLPRRTSRLAATSDQTRWKVRATRRRGADVRPTAVRLAAKVLSGRKDLQSTVLSGRKDLQNTVLSGRKDLQNTVLSGRKSQRTSLRKHLSVTTTDMNVHPTQRTTQFTVECTTPFASRVTSRSPADTWSASRRT